MNSEKTPPGRELEGPVKQTAGGVQSEHAKTAKPFYRRRLPHFQSDGRPVLVTFATYHRWELPARAREIVLKHCLHDHGREIELYCAVVMPDHVHLLLRLLEDEHGVLFGLVEIVGAIKSVSSRAIAKTLGRHEPVWQDESHDHVLRRNEDLEEVAEYICNNPVRKGLCSSFDEYPYLWRQWVDESSDGKPANDGSSRH